MTGRPRVRGLDGIRAFAVLAVLASHTSGTGLPGGYFGVDAFFALSGYLITSLLVEEFRSTQKIGLRAFWGRRARRLLPALFVLLTAIGIAAALWPSLFSTPGLRGDALSTLFYVANWHLVATHTNYFVATAQPSPLLHTWSLAIEEQFYLLWPLIVLGILRLGRRAESSSRSPDLQLRRRLRLLLTVSVAGALASAAWMAALTNSFDTVRSYYGSDTRAQGLLVGASLALAFSLWGTPRSRKVRRVLTAGGVAGIGTTATLWHFVPDTAPLAFHGGFLLAATATAGIIACVVAVPRGAISWALGLGPVRYIGAISYGMYLWYWPVVLVMTPARTHVGGFGLFGARAVVITAIAAASARFVENPIRRRTYTPWKLRLAAPMAAGLSALAVFASTLVPAEVGAVPATAAAARLAVGSGAPVKILLLGDSMAGSLAGGLSVVASGYGAVVANEGIPGCSLSMDKASLFLTFSVRPSPPCDPANPQAIFDAWRTWVDAWNPDVVLYFARGEVLDQQIGTSTTWVHIGEPAFDTRLANRFDQALQTLGSRGAHVFLLGSPLYQSDEAAGSTSPWGEDDPSRVAVDDTLMRVAAAAYPGASFLDVGAWLSPGGHYTAKPNGVDARCGDGVHLTVAGAEWVARRLLPLVIPDARSHHDVSPGGSWPGGALPAPVPSWYASLPC